MKEKKRIVTEFRKKIQGHPTSKVIPTEGCWASPLGNVGPLGHAQPLGGFSPRRMKDEGRHVFFKYIYFFEAGIIQDVP